MQTRHPISLPHASPLPAAGLLLASSLVLSACADTAADDPSGADTSSGGDSDPSDASLSDTAPTATLSDSDSASGEASTGADTTDATDPSTDDTSGTGTPVACDVVPGPWDAPDWETNAADALAMRARLDALTGDPLMRGAETGAVVLGGLQDLIEVWDGTPSLADAANPGFVPIAEDALAEFVAVIAAGEQDLIDAGGDWAPGPDGGVWGDADRGINEGGLEVRQIVDKGGFAGGVLYAWAVGLTEGEIEPATIDAIAAAWGSNATLDPTLTPTDSASYGYQMGFHADMVAALGDAKAYAADGACVAERDAAIVTFFNLWERSMYARLVFYGNRAEGKLLVATTDTEFADVLHDLGEGLGLAIGFRGLPAPATGPLVGGARIITDDAIDQITAAFGIDLDDLGASGTGLFVESLPDLEAAVETAEGVVMDVYGVDIATLQQWIMPTPG